MGAVEQLLQVKFTSGSVSQITSRTAGLPSAQANKFTSENKSATLVKTQQTIAGLTNKMNSINIDVNTNNIQGGNQPNSLTELAKQILTTVLNPFQSPSTLVSNTKPMTGKVEQLLSKQENGINKSFLNSENILLLLEENTNKILNLSDVNYVSIDNGQIVAQPIQNEKITTAVNNIQQVINTYVNTIDRYARMVYNTDPILTSQQIITPGQNISLYHIIKFINTIVALYVKAIEIKIKIRKIQDGITAANALATIPPNIPLATEYTTRALTMTADEKIQMDDAAETLKLIDNTQKRIEFYGQKYDSSKNRLLNLKSLIDEFQNQLINSSLQNVNNYLTGSLNTLSGSYNTWTGSLQK